MPDDREQPAGSQATAGGWSSVHVMLPLPWKLELQRAAKERATTVSDLVRAAVRQVMIERPR